MQPALRLDVCICGIHSETSCSGCGTPVCRYCSHLEITTCDPKNIVLNHYCPACKKDIKKNPWGNLYWDGLKDMYN